MTYAIHSRPYRRKKKQQQQTKKEPKQNDKWWSKFWVIANNINSFSVSIHHIVWQQQQHNRVINIVLPFDREMNFDFNSMLVLLAIRSAINGTLLCFFFVSVIECSCCARWKRLSVTMMPIMLSKLPHICIFMLINIHHSVVRGKCSSHSIWICSVCKMATFVSYIRDDNLNRNVVVPIHMAPYNTIYTVGSSTCMLYILLSTRHSETPKNINYTMH